MAVTGARGVIGHHRPRAIGRALSTPSADPRTRTRSRRSKSTSVTSRGSSRPLTVSTPWSIWPPHRPSSQPGRMSSRRTSSGRTTCTRRPCPPASPASSSRRRITPSGSTRSAMHRASMTDLRAICSPRRRRSGPILHMASRRPSARSSAGTSSTITTFRSSVCGSGRSGPTTTRRLPGSPRPQRGWTCRRRPVSPGCAPPG